jgi:hypothetical protein
VVFQWRGTAGEIVEWSLLGCGFRCSVVLVIVCLCPLAFELLDMDFIPFPVSFPFS